MTEQRRRSLARSLGAFFGHIIGAVRSAPAEEPAADPAGNDQPTTVRQVVEERKENSGRVILRRTTIEEMEVQRDETAPKSKGPPDH